MSLSYLYRLLRPVGHLTCKQNLKTASVYTLLLANGVLYFTASNSANGRELWKLDSSAGLPVLVGDLRPGNGSSNPLYLYPSEQTKAYLGLTNESGFSDITYDGEAVPSYSLEQRISYTGAAGLRFNQRSFAVISLSAFKQVGRSGRSLTVIGEPNLSYRYAIVQPIFTRPLVPQVEFIGAFKAGSARNSSSSRDPEMLDVGGSGFDELTTGVDVWFGMTPIQFGGSFIHKLASPERTRLGLEHPGDTQTLSLSIGKSWTFLKVSLGPVVSRRFRKTRESSLVSDSDSYRQNFFLTLDGKIANQKFIS